ncbi:MAG: DNA repair protein RadA [Christensenellales bacterium]|jgi:DNA repair protein RadA/Sms
MSALKSVFICGECGYESRKWLGRCPSCQTWNSFQEETPAPVRATASGRTPSPRQQPVPLNQVPREQFARTSTRISELDRVLGGGIVGGSMVLIGGEPGVGKSTLLLQAAQTLAAQDKRVTVISGEESAHQVALRAARLGVDAGNILIYSQTAMDDIMETLHADPPDYVIVDSIQTMHRPDLSSAPGSVTQVRECASQFMQLAKTRGSTVFLVGHVTKSGAIAGPRVLEHMVDTVLYFEGETFQSCRVLRCAKNRFGPSHEIGLFTMEEDGMRPVEDPAGMFLTRREQSAPGAVVTATAEGARTMLVEIQALTSQTAFPSPRRQASGVDYNRMVLLLAVMEKRVGYRLWDQDVYVNVAGGLRLNEPAADLAVAAAVASSVNALPPPWGTGIFGEIALTGEVRPVSMASQRLWELKRAGFNRAILPKANTRGLSSPEGMELLPVTTVAEALSKLKE